MNLGRGLRQFGESEPSPIRRPTYIVRSACRREIGCGGARKAAREGALEDSVRGGLLRPVYFYIPRIIKSSTTHFSAILVGHRCCRCFCLSVLCVYFGALFVLPSIWKLNDTESSVFRGTTRCCHAVVPCKVRWNPFGLPKQGDSVTKTSLCKSDGGLLGPGRCPSNVAWHHVARPGASVVTGRSSLA